MNVKRNARERGKATYIFFISIILPRIQQKHPYSLLRSDFYGFKQLVQHMACKIRHDQRTLKMRIPSSGCVMEPQAQVGMFSPQPQEGK